MAYTVKQAGAMSGVSVRALHFYDETGLLKPARSDKRNEPGKTAIKAFEKPLAGIQKSDRNKALRSGGF